MTRPHVVVSGGVRLAVETVGHGPPLVYAHGLTGSRAQTRVQLAPLARGFAVTLYDQRGHGESETLVHEEAYDIGSLTQDFAAVVDWAGAGRCVVGGTSMGAAVALRYAAAQPDRVAALLVAAPAFGPGPHRASDVLADIGAVVTKLGIEGLIAQLQANDWSALGLPEDVAQHTAAVWRSHRADSIAAACAAVSRWRLGLPLAALESVDAPALVVAWPGDEVHPLALAADIVAHLPRARLLLFDRTRYFTAPADLGRMYERFLAEAQEQVARS